MPVAIGFEEPQLLGIADAKHAAWHLPFCNPFRNHRIDPLQPRLWNRVQSLGAPNLRLLRPNRQLLQGEDRYEQ
jgi:hypothetical protein